MHTDIVIEFPKSNWVDDDTGRVLVKHDATPQIGVSFHVFWGQHSQEFVMMSETDEFGDTDFVVLAADDLREICKGWQMADFKYGFRALNCVRESYASPFIAAAQVIYNVL